MGKTIEQKIITANGSKKLHLEFLRIIACFFVIFNHTAENGFMLFSQYADTSIRYWLYMSLSVFCKFAVAMFFAISGALLLKKEESIKTIYRKRVLRMCIVLLLASALYYLLNNLNSLSKLSLEEFFEILYVSDHYGHLWYLYAFIPFLMALPLLRPMVRSLKNEHFLYLAICVLLFNAVLPVAEFFVGKGDFTLNKHFRMDWIAQAAVIYPFMGYYIENRMDAGRAKKYLPHLWIVNIVAITVTCMVSWYRARITGDLTESGFGIFNSLFSLVNMFAVYVTAKCFFDSKKVKPCTAKAICSLGSCTLGIYIIHIAVLRLLLHFNVLNFLRVTLGINPMISCLVLCLAVLVVSYALTLAVKQIPGLKKLL